MSGEAAGDIAGRLAQRREEILTRLSRLQSDIAIMIDASRADNADDEHDPEGSTIAFERAQLIALKLAAEHDLRDVEQALVAHQNARYGICQVCGDPIGVERLELRPASSTCVRCAALRSGGPGGR